MVAGENGLSGARAASHVGLEPASGPGDAIIQPRVPEAALVWDFLCQTGPVIWDRVLKVSTISTQSINTAGQVEILAFNEKVFSGVYEVFYKLANMSAHNSHWISIVKTAPWERKHTFTARSANFEISLFQRPLSFPLIIAERFESDNTVHKKRW